jgi:VWFA-related protein
MKRSTLLTVLFLWATLALAQGADTRDAVTDRISVTVVEIPVQVVRKGEPVRGLSIDDFEVYDRGELQEIVSFDVLDLRRGQDDDDSVGVSEGADSESRVRHLLLLFDLDFTDWRELPRALDGARELVGEQLHSSDRLAIGFYSTVFGPQLLHDFIVDREASAVAIEVIQALVDRHPRVAAAKMAELAQLTDLTLEGDSDADAEAWSAITKKWSLMSRVPAGESPEDLAEAMQARDRAEHSIAYEEINIDPVISRAETHPDLYDENMMRMVRHLGRSLSELAQGLSHVPDPKHVILLSQGFPTRFLQDRNQSTRILFRLDPALKAFVETGWILQAIDVRGIPSIDEPVFDGNSLFHMAEHTGGRLYENFGRIGKATGKILERSSVTYILTIQPDVSADGSFHALDVRLEDKRGVEIAHRPGYRAPLPASRLARLRSRSDVTQVVLSDREVRDFEFDLLTLAVPSVGARARVPVVVELDGDVLLENPFGDTASIEVHAYGLDESGGIQDLFLKRLDINLNRDGKRLKRGGLRVVGQLELTPGMNEVRVLLRNLANDAISLSRATVEVAELQPGVLVTLPPIFIDRSRDWVSLSLDESSDSEGVQLALVDLIGLQYFPRLLPSFRPSGAQEVVLNLYYAGQQAPNLQVRVLSARGKEVEAAKVKLVNRIVGVDGGTGLVVTLRTKGLEPGGYMLEVALLDQQTGERATSSHRFKIVEAS